jgi:hypothetical protein
LLTYSLISFYLTSLPHSFHLFFASFSLFFIPHSCYFISSSFSSVSPHPHHLHIFFIAIFSSIFACYIFGPFRPFGTLLLVSCCFSFLPFPYRSQWRAPTVCMKAPQRVTSIIPSAHGPHEATADKPYIRQPSRWHF